MQPIEFTSNRSETSQKSEYILWTPRNQRLGPSIQTINQIEMALSGFVLLFITTIIGDHISRSSGTAIIDHEERLTKRLLTNYDKSIRPGAIDENGTKEPLEVNLAFSLRRIMGSDDRLETMSLFMYIIEDWIDPRLGWEPLEFGNITTIMIAPRSVWTPLAYLPNLAIMNPDDKRERFNVIIELITDPYLDRMYPRVRILTYALLQERCRYNMRHFPFDHQRCEMCVTNTQYLNTRIVYRPRVTTHEYFVRGGEWDLVEISVQTESSYGVFNDASAINGTSAQACFELVVQRRSIYYVVNLFVPTVTIGVLNTVGLFASIDTEHKELDFSSLGQTTLLALGVMLLTVADQTPRGSERISLMGFFFLAMICQTFLAALTAIYLKKYSRRLGERRKPPTIINPHDASLTSSPIRWTVKRVARVCMIIHLTLIILITVLSLGIGGANELKRVA